MQCALRRAVAAAAAAANQAELLTMYCHEVQVIVEACKSDRNTAQQQTVANDVSHFILSERELLWYHGYSGRP